MERISLFSGDCQVVGNQAILHTRLGSCVAVCLFDPEARLGGMNHILRPGRGPDPASDLDGRFAEDAVELLLNRMLAQGARAERIVAKVFGGGNVILAHQLGAGVGAANISSALDTLRRLGIPIMARDLGGPFGREVIFHTESGLARVKKTPAMNN